MNAKKIVKKEINELVIAFVELANDLLPEDTPDEKLGDFAEAITEVQEQAIENLNTLMVAIVRETVKETVAGVSTREEKKKTRLRKLLPKDLEPPEEVAMPPVVPAAPAVMEHVSPPPREVSATATALELPQDFTEAAAQALGGGGGSILGDDFVDLAEDDGYGHKLGMTLAEQSRAEAGLPVKLNRPHIVVGMPKKEPPTVSTVKVESSVPKEEVVTENFTLEDLEDMTHGD
jgi:hypothetical protein